MADKNPYLQRAIDKLGDVSAVAKLCDVTDSAVRQWHSNGIPGKHVRKIEEACEGEPTRYELCPEVFGDPPKYPHEVRAQ